MLPVLYFHGFASSPASAKITALRPLLEPAGIALVTPDLNVPSFERLDWEAMVRRGLDEARRIDPAAVVGSSLGALVALEVVARGIRRPLVLIAPALGIGERWKSHIPDGDPVVVFNHTRGENAPIHRAFFGQLARLSVDDVAPPVSTTVIMGRKDETVPFELVRDTWSRWEAAGLAAGSKFVPVDEGDHGLTGSVDLIAREIVGSAGGASNIWL